jgi:2-C-methyl-D-erythritol 4-phosphate cytidylyltransferase
VTPEQRHPTAAAVIVAAGSSTRMGAGGARKPLMPLRGRPVLEHACSAFDAALTVSEIIVVAHPDDLPTIERWCAERAAFDKVKAVVAGGAERSDSVRRGARWCAFEVDVICVHDAARPLVQPARIDAVVRRAAETGAALLAHPVRDTLKRSADGVFAEATVDRAGLFAAETPQAFAARPFRELLARAEREAFSPTDDAALWERYTGPVALVEGELANLKLTTPEDLALADAILVARAEARA